MTNKIKLLPVGSLVSLTDETFAAHTKRFGATHGKQGTLVALYADPETRGGVSCLIRWPEIAEMEIWSHALIKLADRVKAPAVKEGSIVSIKPGINSMTPLGASVRERGVVEKLTAANDECPNITATVCWSTDLGLKAVEVWAVKYLVAEEETG